MNKNTSNHLKINVIGGGPGGLYFSILTKKALPNCEINVYERNNPDDSFGFGVVFSDETLGAFLKRDPLSYERIRENFAYWDDLIIARDGEEIKISGNGFCGCSRKTLLQLLHQRCREEGISLHFETEMQPQELQKTADVVVVADGIGSQIRTHFSAYFKPVISNRTNRFVWLGSTKPLEAFTYFFKNCPEGVIVAHTYQYEPNRSTWVFECSDETFQNFGFNVFDETETIAQLERIFATELDGHALIGNKSHWRQFPHIVNTHWSHENLVLLGDAKATAHFSIGSGTKLAMESAISLSDAIVANPENIPNALTIYEQKRRPEVNKIQKAALISMQWFEQMDLFGKEPFYRLAFGCMTRSHRVSYENLSIRDSQFTSWVSNSFSKENHQNQTTSPVFSSFQIGTCTIPNRWVMQSQKSAALLPVQLWGSHYLTPCVGNLGLQIFAPISVQMLFSNTEEITEIKRITQKIKTITATKVGWQINLTDVNFSTKNILTEIKSCGVDVLVLSLSRMGRRELESEHFHQLINELTAETAVLLHWVLPPRRISVEEMKAFQSITKKISAIETLGFWFSLDEEDQHSNDAEVDHWFFEFLQDFRKNRKNAVIISGLNESVDLANTQIINHHTDAVAWEKTWVFSPFEALKVAAEEGFTPTTLHPAAAHFWKGFLKEKQFEKQKWVGMKKALKPKSNKK